MLQSSENENLLKNFFLLPALTLFIADLVSRSMIIDIRGEDLQKFPFNSRERSAKWFINFLDSILRELPIELPRGIFRAAMLKCKRTFGRQSIHSSRRSRAKHAFRNSKQRVKLHSSALELISTFCRPLPLRAFASQQSSSCSSNRT